MSFITINELIGDTKKKIDQLNVIVDTLLMEYRTASEIIDDTTDRRKKYLNDLIELNQTIGSIVDVHPSLNIDKIWQNATAVISAIANLEETDPKTII